MISLVVKRHKCNSNLMFDLLRHSNKNGIKIKPNGSAEILSSLEIIPRNHPFLSSFDGPLEKMTRVKVEVVEYTLQCNSKLRSSKMTVQLTKTS